jgi:8-oxo-dGTP pyrophosphatase MutT (NUDIX family)
MQRRVSRLTAAARSPRRFDLALATAIRANLDAFGRAPLERADLRRAAVAIAVVPGADGRACFLLTRRAASLNAHGGQWALPGGRVDHGENELQTALRELEEEVGIRASAEAVVGSLDDYVTRSGYVITPVVVWCDDSGSVRPNPHEVAAVHSVPLDDLDHPDVPRVHHIEESDRPVLSIPLLGTYIHAPTAAVLYQFREVAFHGRSTRVAHFEQPVFAWR